MTRKIIDAIGEPAVLEQWAEECLELGKECLKLARILRGENPCRDSREDVMKRLLEEIGDIHVSEMAWLAAQDDDCAEVINDTIDRKTVRWEKSVSDRKGRLWQGIRKLKIFAKLFSRS